MDSAVDGSVVVDTLLKAVVIGGDINHGSSTIVLCRFLGIYNS